MINHLRPAPGWVVVLLSVAALSLAGCGRKGALDLPPSASGSTAPVAHAQAEERPNLFNANPADTAPAASRGRKRSFVLDPLLGDDK